MKQAKRGKKASFLAPCNFLKNGCSWRATTRQLGSLWATYQSTSASVSSELLKPLGGSQALGLVAQMHQGQGSLSAVPARDGTKCQCSRTRVFNSS